MDRFCSVERDLIKDTTGKLHYVQCGKPATHCVPDTIREEGYHLCPDHTETGKERKWTVEKIGGEG